MNGVNGHLLLLFDLHIPSPPSALSWIFFSSSLIDIRFFIRFIHLRISFLTCVKLNEVVNLTYIKFIGKIVYNVCVPILLAPVYLGMYLSECLKNVSLIQCADSIL